MKSKIKIGIAVILGLALVGGAVYFGNSETLTGRLSNPGVRRADHSMDNNAPPPSDVCSNLEGMQNEVPLGYIQANNICSVDPLQAGVLSVQMDPSVSSHTVVPGTANGPFLRLLFSTTGTLPINVKKLSIIATNGMNSIESVHLLDADAGIDLGEAIPDGSGHFILERQVVPLFNVTPGRESRISVIARVRENPRVGSPIALGLYVNTTENSPLDFIAQAGNALGGPNISYNEGEAQFSNGDRTNQQIIRLQWVETIRNADRTFRIIQGNTMTFAAAPQEASPVRTPEVPAGSKNTPPAQLKSFFRK